MSRIGKQPIPVPTGVEVMIDGQKVSVKGPKGTLGLKVADPITVARNDDGAHRGRPSRRRAAPPFAARTVAHPGVQPGDRG